MLNKAKNQRILFSQLGNIPIDNIILHDDSWDDRLHIDKLSNYNSARDKYFRPISSSRIKSRSLQRPTTSTAKSSESLGILKNLSRPSVSTRRTTEMNEDKFNVLKEELEILWKKHQIPNSHRSAFLSRVNVIPLYSSIPIIIKEIDNLNLGKSTIQNLIHTVIKREAILKNLHDISSIATDEGASLQCKITENLSELRNYSVKIVENVMKWRESMNNYHLMFDWENEDYFERMKRDVEFIPRSGIGNIVSLPIDFSTFIVQTQEKHSILNKSRSRSLQNHKTPMGINNELMTRIRLAQTVFSNSTSTGSSSTNSTFRSSVSASTTRRVIKDKHSALSLNKKRKYSANKRKIIKAQEIKHPSLSRGVSEKSIEESLDDLPNELLKELSEFIAGKVINTELSNIIPALIMESYNEMISASLVLFSSSVLDKYINEVLRSEIPIITNEAYVEVIDCEYVDFQKQILIEVIHEELFIIAEKCGVMILSSDITEKFIHNIEVQESVLESLNEEHQQNEKLIVVLYTEVLENMLYEEWLEILAEDELSDYRMENNWELLPINAKKELMKTEGCKINAKTYEKIYFDILNEIVAKTWLEGIINDTLGKCNGLDEIMPIPKTEEINTVKRIKYPSSMFRYI